MIHWVYLLTENYGGNFIYTVGFFDPDGTWYGESDHSDRDSAAARCNYLNGGKGAEEL